MESMQKLRATPLNRRERDLAIQLTILHNALVKAECPSEFRLKSIPNGWRDYRLLLKLVDSLRGRLCKTYPEKMLRQLHRYVHDGKVSITLPRAVHEAKYMYLDTDDYVTLVETCPRNECALCMKDRRESKRCPLRNALMDTAPPEMITDGDCEYREYAYGLAKGKDVWI